MDVQTQAVVVKRIVFQLADRELALSIEEAKELRKSLNELFMAESVVAPVIQREVVEKHHYHDRPFYWPYGQAIWTSGVGSKYELANGTVYCSTGSSTSGQCFPPKVEAK